MRPISSPTTRRSASARVLAPTLMPRAGEVPTRVRLDEGNAEPRPSSRAAGLRHPHPARRPLNRNSSASFTIEYSSVAPRPAVVVTAVTRPRRPEMRPTTWRLEDAEPTCQAQAASRSFRRLRSAGRRRRAFPRSNVSTARARLDPVHPRATRRDGIGAPRSTSPRALRGSRPRRSWSAPARSPRRCPHVDPVPRRYDRARRSTMARAGSAGPGRPCGRAVSMGQKKERYIGSFCQSRRGHAWR